MKRFLRQVLLDWTGLDWTGIINGCFLERKWIAGKLYITMFFVFKGFKREFAEGYDIGEKLAGLLNGNRYLAPYVLLATIISRALTTRSMVF